MIRHDKDQRTFLPKKENTSRKVEEPTKRVEVEHPVHAMEITEYIETLADLFQRLKITESQEKLGDPVKSMETEDTFGRKECFHGEE